MNLFSFADVEAWFGLFMCQFYMEATPLRPVESLNTDRRKWRLRCCHPTCHAKKQQAFPKHFIHWAIATALASSSVTGFAHYLTLESMGDHLQEKEVSSLSRAVLLWTSVQYYKEIYICFLPFAHSFQLTDFVRVLCCTIWCPDFSSLLNYCHTLQPL